jgi:hypothetical protein
MKRWRLNLIMLLALPSPLLAEELYEALMPRLQAGEVVVRSVRDEESGGAARVMALFQTPVEQLWDVLLSCEAAFRYLKGMTGCEILESEPRRNLVNHVIRRPWPLSPMDIVFEAHYTPYSLIDFRLVEGNLDRFEGQWRFVEKGDGFILDYEVHAKPAVPAPRLLVRHSIRYRLPDLVACLRALSDGSGSAEQKAKDLDRCPGQ